MKALLLLLITTNIQAQVTSFNPSQFNKTTKKIAFNSEKAPLNNCLEQIDSRLPAPEYNQAVDSCHSIHIKSWQNPEWQSFYINMGSKPKGLEGSK